MLMMSRRAGETILIGDDIEIVIAHIGRSRVKIGIRAPRAMPVLAREVKLVRDENLAAAASVADALRLPRRDPPRASLKLSSPFTDEISVRQDAGSELNERISRCLSPFRPT